MVVKITIWTHNKEAEIEVTRSELRWLALIPSLDYYPDAGEFILREGWTVDRVNKYLNLVDPR